jgi:uncharacterized protein (DUF885 family)
MTYRSPIFEIADTYTSEIVKFSPLAATGLGVAGYDHLLDDFSLEQSNKVAEYKRSIVDKLSAMNPIDDTDRIAKEVMLERLESELNLHDSHEAHILFGVLWSTVSSVRQIFELMPRESEEHFVNIESRLRAVDQAFDSWQSCLSDVADRGKVPAQRQAKGVSEQLKVHGNGNYSAFVERIDPDNAHPSLRSAAKEAEAACLKLAAWFDDVYIGRCNPKDPVGKDRYQMWARYFTGANLNILETYEWGVQELARINERMKTVASKILPNAQSLKEVSEYLEHADGYVIEGEGNLVAKLKDFTEKAIKRLDGEIFDIDERIRQCDARIAPAGSAAAPYYIGPSEDLKRPGTTWFPTLGRTSFSFWHIASTWYHEAVPGHHLQFATVIINTDRLSRFQRNDGWNSGYGEGWALYAERLMDELGAFEDPGYELGYLSAQALRAARVVVDIGMHLELPNFDGGVWDAESAVKLLREQALLQEDNAVSEVERYLGLPGQAISYKVGERYWLEAREAAKARLGERFDLKKFHNFALALGPMALDSLKAEIGLWNGQ